MKKRYNLPAVRLSAVLLSISLLLSGCFGVGILPVPDMPTVPPAASSADAPTVRQTESTLAQTGTTETVDWDDEALIRWQNAGQKDYLPDGQVALVPFSEMEYVRPDVESLYADFDALIERAASEKNAEALLDDYYELYGQYISFYSMDTLANIRYSLNTADPYYKGEYDFCEDETPILEEKLEALNKAFAASPSRDDLEEQYFGEDYFESFDDYEVYTNPEFLRLSQEEEALMREYRDLTADIQVEYNGVTKPLEEWLESKDYLEYIGALKAYYAQYNAAVGDVFVRLVKVRRQLAAALDFDSYAAYSYEIGYSRDYTPEQGRAFIEGIHEHLAPVLNQAEADQPLGESYGTASEQDVMEMVQSAAQQLGGAVWDAFRFMRAYELCDIGRSDSKIDASFQSYIYDYEAPFVLVNAQGSGEDYTTFAHEFGHFTDSYYNYGAVEDLETAETFSQSMEFLALKYTETLSDREKKNLLRAKLLDSLQTFVYQAAYADFEERVYALDPEEITVGKINALYRQCCKDYGVYEESFDFYYSQAWIDVIHFFEAPYYIISYCVSAETALQVYRLEAAGEGEGVKAYFRLLDRDYEAGVQQVMEDAELENPFRDEVLQQTAAFFKKELRLKQ